MKGTAMATMFSVFGIASMLMAFGWFSARQTAHMGELLKAYGQA
jgi:hypothetical protein